MVFTVTIDRDEGGVWIVECPSIPGCVSQGETKEGGVLISTLRNSAFLCVSALNGFFTVKDAKLRRGRRERLFKLSHYPKEEALTNVKEAIRLCLEVREKGLPLTIETKQVEVAA
jgi:predicted RNase H-like HicB family nuclease